MGSRPSARPLPWWSAPPVQDASLLVAAFLACQSITEQAEAGFIVTIQEQGGNVVATGSGTIDLTGLTLSGGAGAPAAFVESRGAILFLGSSVAQIHEYSGAIGPITWGAGGPTNGLYASTATGDTVGIYGSQPLGPSVTVPAGYVSGASLTATDTFTGQTVASLGLIPGTYTYTWGSGPTADFFTVNVVGAAVPESTPILLALTGGVVVLAYGRFGRGKTRKSQGPVSPHRPAD